jgi:integrase
MAIHKLNPGFVEKVTDHGVYSDGGGLYLKVREGSKAWVFRFARSRFGGKGEAEMGLGPVHTVSIHEARELARQFRLQLLQGDDPLKKRKAAEDEKKRKAGENTTFGACVEDYLAFESKRRRWGLKTYTDRKRAFETNVYPKLKNSLVSAIDHRQIADVVNPIIERAPTTGVNVLRDIEGALARATSHLLRTGDNPANRKGPIGHLLVSLDHDVEPHASLPYPEVAAFVARVQAHKAIKTAAWMAGQQLLFVILTAVRVGQTYKMRWDEIDRENRLWICPWQRTKTGKKKKRDHLVPLSKPAFAILERMRALQKQAGLELDFVFVRNLPLPDRPIYYQKKRRLRQRELANVALGRCSASNFLRRGLRCGGDITVHGFRTSFSSWANDQLTPTIGFGHVDIEMALDHDVKNTGGEAPVPVAPIARRYARDAKRLEQRRKLLDAWGEYCFRSPADVVPFQQSEVKAR